MVGMLQRREVDVSITLFTINSARSKVISFSLPYYLVSPAVFIRKKAVGGYGELGTYFSDVNPEVWAALAATVVAVASCLVLMNRFSRVHPVIEKCRVFNCIS